MREGGLVVYVLEGWFGDAEWREGIYESQADADAECARLWETQRSAHAPDWVQGYCKFAVEPVAVIRGAQAVRPSTAPNSKPDAPSSEATSPTRGPGSSAC